MARTALFSRNQPGGVFTIADIEQHPGEIYFVDSTAAGAGATLGHGGNPDKPFSSIAYAFSSDVLAAGDTVYVMPNHAEAISAAGTITADIAGVRVIGLGWGAKRPTLTWTATDGTIAVSATSVEFKNFLTRVTIDEVVSMWNWTGAWGVMDAVDFRLAEAAEEAIQFLLTTSGASDLTVRNCSHYQATASASNAQWLKVLGARSVIEDNVIQLAMTNNSASIVIDNSAAAADLTIARNRITVISAGAIAISCHGSSTGQAHDNRVVSTGTLAGKIALGGLSGNENYVATTANKNGILDPVVA